MCIYPCNLFASTDVLNTTVIHFSEYIGESVVQFLPASATARPVSAW